MEAASEAVFELQYQLVDAQLAAAKVRPQPYP